MKNLAGLADIQNDIARDVWPNGAILRCRCGYSEHIGSKTAGEYLKHGWPRHCGLTMVCEEP